MEINSIAHVILTVRDMATSRPFYHALLSHLGLSEVVNSETFSYFVGGEPPSTSARRRHRPRSIGMISSAATSTTCVSARATARTWTQRSHSSLA